MMIKQDTDLEFAYKYPFSEEAKRVVSALNANALNPVPMAMGRADLEECLSKGFLNYGDSYNKLEYLQSYVYSRLLVSALKNASFISKYAAAEAYRSYMALERDTKDNIVRVAGELGIDVDINGEYFSMGMFQFLKHAPPEGQLALVNLRLGSGIINIDKLQFAQLLRIAISKAIAVGLPIKYEDIPKQVVSYAKEIKLPQPQVSMQRPPGRASAWIEKLMFLPIDDGRHRVVNLILAPYLINVKGLEVDAAKAIIIDYIEKCKTVNPATKVNEEYISYQCRYAKEHGMRPMSLKRAMEELGGAIDFSMLMEK